MLAQKPRAPHRHPRLLAVAAVGRSPEVAAGLARVVEAEPRPGCPPASCPPAARPLAPEASSPACPAAKTVQREAALALHTQAAAPPTSRLEPPTKCSEQAYSAPAAVENFSGASSLSERPLRAGCKGYSAARGEGWKFPRANDKPPCKYASCCLKRRGQSTVARYPLQLR